MNRAMLGLAIVSSLLSAAVGGAAAALVVPTPSHAGPEAQAVSTVVRAQRFELVDTNGILRAVLTAGGSDGWTALQLNDQNGNAHIGMAVATDQAGIAIGQGDMHAHVRIALIGEEPAIEVTNEAGAMVDLGVNADGTLGVVGLDRTGQVRANLGLASNGQPSITLRDSSGGTVWNAP